MENSTHLFCKHKEMETQLKYAPPLNNVAPSPNPLLCRSTCYAHESVGEDGELDSVELGAEDAVAVGTHGQADIT